MPFLMPAMLGGGDRTAVITLSGTVTDVNIATLAAAAIDITRPDVVVTVILEDGLRIRASSPAAKAITRGTGWGLRSLVRIVIGANVEIRIQGAGGVGGDGAGVIIDTGKGFAVFDFGGGGGGAGDEPGLGGTACGDATNGLPGTNDAGGAGGVQGNSNGTCAGTNGGDGGDAFELPVAGDQTIIEIDPTATCEIWGGAGGGVNGGRGGNPGEDGQDGGISGLTDEIPGEAGNAFTGSGVSALTVIGTGDFRGADQ